mmetsp:Transcript_42723/g.102201  ORF Transcript_42723/g.102201 Transcript_42723/m.102201 type:complete len:228 (-) Transcript_42723:1374-2057(-)
MSSPSASPICWKRYTASSPSSRALPVSPPYKAMSAKSARAAASPWVMPASPKTFSASSAALVASGIFPFIICACPNVNSALPSVIGESSLRAMLRASFAILVDLSAVALYIFSLLFPSSSFCEICMMSARQVKTMTLTSSSRSPSSFTRVRSEPSTRSAASNSFSITWTSISDFRAAASPSESCTSVALSCASRAEAAAFLKSPSANCAEESCSNAATSPSTCFASE